MSQTLSTKFLLLLTCLALFACKANSAAKATGPTGPTGNTTPLTEPVATGPSNGSPSAAGANQPGGNPSNQGGGPTGPTGPTSPSGPSSTSGPTGPSGNQQPPVIIILTPQPNQQLGPANVLSGSVSSNGGSIKSVTIHIDGVVQNISFNNSNPALWLWSFTPLLPNGPHSLAVTTTDNDGNHVSSSVTFNWTNPPPTLAVLSCTAPDDRTRTATVASVGATYAATAPSSVLCSAANLTTTSQSFYTYADLYEQNQNVSQVVFQVTDIASISSVVGAVSKNGTPLTGAIPLLAGTSAGQYVLSLDLATLGLAAVSIAATDSYSLTVTMTDEFNQTATVTIVFSLNLLPTPLLVTQDNTVSLGSYTYENGEIFTAFQWVQDTTQTKCGKLWCPTQTENVSHYILTNVSDRPEFVNLNWSNANSSPTMTRTVFRAPYVTDLYFSPPLGTTCSDVNEVQWDGYPNCTDSTNICEGNLAAATTCTTTSSFLFGKQSQELQFTPTATVTLPPSTAPISNTSLTLAPGATVSLEISVTDLALVGGYAFLSDSGNTVTSAEWPTATVIPNVTALLDYALPTPPFIHTNIGLGNSSYYFPPLAIIASAGSPEPYNYGATDNTSPQLVGISDQLQIATGLNGSSLVGAVTLAGAVAERNDYFSGNPTFSFAKKEADGNTHVFGTVALEREVAFTASWNPLIAMTGGEPTYAATGNQQPIAISSTVQPATTPNLCPFQNGLCNVDLSGW